MARHQYIVLSQAQPGREEEYQTWYDTQHLADVLRVEGVVSAKRLNIGFQKVYDVEVPRYTSLTMYELECDDPAVLIARIAGMAGAAAMPMSDAANKAGMIQVVAKISD